MISIFCRHPEYRNACWPVIRNHLTFEKMENGIKPNIMVMIDDDDNDNDDEIPVMGNVNRIRGIRTSSSCYEKKAYEKKANEKK